MTIGDRRRLVPVVAGIALSVLFGAVSVLATAGGHGTYVPAALLFPAALLLAIELTIVSNAVLWFAAVQWPLYGLMVAVAAGRGRERGVMIWLTLIHAVLVAACFLLDRGQFL